MSETGIVWDRMRQHNYPYVKDDLDRAAFELYCRTGYNPPVRPGGVLTESERRVWNQWRDKARNILRNG